MATTVALDALLYGEDLLNMPPLNGVYSCDTCPFGTLTQPYENIANDPSEAYYSCSLIDDNKVWGEDPKCTLKDWQKQARLEWENSQLSVSTVERNH